MADHIPPAYSTRADNNIVDSDVLPPTYTAPTQFDIGSQRTSKPLVNIPQVKGHLALLHAFASLKKQVEGLEEAIPHMPSDLERRWAWFVALAVERFDIWCQGLQSSDAGKSLEVILPPIDVMMVWHAYMLNPMWYADDWMRLPACQVLNAVGAQFANALDGRLQSILSAPLTKSRIDFWLIKTALPFDHVQSSYSLTNKTVLCPQCRARILVDMMTPEGSGYLQQKFKASCPRGCTIEITKDTLALRKLAQDLASNSEFSLAGTSFNPSSPAATAMGKAIKNRFHNNATAYPQSFQSDEKLCLNIIGYAKSSLSKLKRQILVTQVGPSRRIATRILSAYTDDKPYSVELVGAVLRQGSFVKKMYELGWTSPGFFDDVGDELALLHAICRYHAFLDLMSSSPASFFVPTLDIDLVWHTHQLMPNIYKSDCTQYVGRFIDHDDKVEGLKLSSAFDITCRAWKERFFVQYSHCGCPIPGDTIGSKLVKLVSGARSPAPPSHLLPFDRPDLLSATHASDHNAVHFQSRDSNAHRLAQASYEKLARKKERKAQKAAERAAATPNDGGRGLSVSSPVLHPPHAPRLQTDRMYSSSRGLPMYAYGIPFLVAVPIFYGAGLGFEGAGCVAPCGNGGGAGCGSRAACGGGASFAGGAGCGGATGGAACGSSEPILFFFCFIR